MTKEEKFNNADGKLKTESPAKERPSRQRAQKRDKMKPLTKIIIRHLPPTMTEEEFLKQIDPLPDHDFYYYAAADWSLGYDATCRAYINLKNYDDVFLFRDRFDGYVFVDSKGAEYPAVVEFAPFQGLAKNKSRKIDPKVNSIELEQHYKNFLEKLEEDREAAAKGGGESKLEFSLDRKKDEKITSTPLLQYLANKKEKRREESKRRTDEKRRQREEEKERRQQRNQPVTKIMSNLDIGGKKDAGKSGGGKENTSEKGDIPDESKNSRSKRRAARDQRRREEHEHKKRERERLEKEQRERGGAVASAKSSEDLKEKFNKEINPGSKQENLNNKSNGRKPAEEVNRKEVKKYSERRERDRKRNRKEQDQRPAISTSDTAIVAAVVNTESAETEPASNSTSTSNLCEISDSVKNFIRSVATVKEFVPKHKQVEAEQMEATQVTDVQSVKEELRKLALFISTEKNEITERAAEQTKTESTTSLEEKQLQKQRLAEERRIRNKDRPSIAIYQPKPRLRLSEESDSKDTALKDVRSNPNSDCESLKKEEQSQRAKKPSRYSERRSERRSKDKRKDDGNENEACETMRRKTVLRKSKSHEEGSDYNEKPEVETATSTAPAAITTKATEYSQEIN